MNEPATTFDSLLRAVARVDGHELAPGEILADTYELIERLGGGGMGIVFRARDLRLGREVAVKTLRPLAAGAAGDDALRLFEREARATAQLLHPNIVTLHHVGVHHDRPFLVLELLGGETLAARLARRRTLAVDEAMRLLDQVLAAVAFAHERGVLHRDLKPANVWITTDERVKVLDFGIALSIDASPGPVTRAAGTPGYMAPEQQDGASQDARTDVWAAAALLVECVLGRRVDAREATASVSTLAVPAETRRVLARALATDPTVRPADAGELRSLLAAATGSSRPIARRPWRWQGAVAVFGVATTATGALAYRLGSREPSPVTAAELASRSWHIAAFGDLLLRIEPSGAVYGVYEHDDGILQGTFAEGVFDGVWCEMPSRHGPDDAGRIQIRFVRDVDRVLLVGSWTYGMDAAAPWQRDFLGISNAMPAITPLDKRIQDHVTCPDGPRVLNERVRPGL